MLIYLDESIKNCLTEPIAFQIQDALQSIALMFRSGVHLVSGDRATLLELSRVKEISASARSAFHRSATRQSQTLSIFEHINTYAIIDYGRGEIESTIINGKKVIKIPITMMQNLVSQAASEIIYEDINDSEIYDIITNWYSKHVMSSPNTPLKYKKVQGGGNRTFAVYQEKQYEAQTFCICITDSDRKYPADDNGETSKKVKEVDDPQRPLSSHLNLDFHEIENLIPLATLEELARTDQARTITDALRLAETNGYGEAKLYWDYKKGLKGHTARGNVDFINYWGAAINSQEPNCENSCTLKNCSCFLLGPWPLKTELDERIRTRPEITPKDCERLTQIWSTIGQSLVSWTIGATPQYT